MKTSNFMAKVAVNKSVLKEFKNMSNERVVYLNNGDEFQIQLFNPHQFTIGAEISINGDTIPGIIVIRPGERHWLERPMNKQKKFKFETYEVEDSSEVSNAIAKNGEIFIRFYKEKENTNITYYEPLVYRSVTPNPWTTYSDQIKLSTDYDYNSQNGITSGKRYMAKTTTDALTNSTAINATITGSDSNSIKCETNALCSEDNLITIDSINNAYFNSVAINAPISKSIETGRISSGSHSNQKFDQIDIDFQTWSFDSETIKILPTSRKPYTNSDLQKIYCTNCGRKLNPKYKFCPYCGEKCI